MTSDLVCKWCGEPVAWYRFLDTWWCGDCRDDNVEEKETK